MQKESSPRGSQAQRTIVLPRLLHDEWPFELNEQFRKLAITPSLRMSAPPDSCTMCASPFGRISRQNSTSSVLCALHAGLATYSHRNVWPRYNCSQLTACARLTIVSTYMRLISPQPSTMDFKQLIYNMIMILSLIWKRIQADRRVTFAATSSTA